MKRAAGFPKQLVLPLPCSTGVCVVSPGIPPLIPRTGVFGFDDLFTGSLETDR
jgi:hypothetical protein